MCMQITRRSFKSVDCHLGPGWDWDPMLVTSSRGPHLDCRGHYLFSLLACLWANGGQEQGILLLFPRGLVQRGLIEAESKCLVSEWKKERKKKTAFLWKHDGLFPGTFARKLSQIYSRYFSATKDENFLPFWGSRKDPSPEPEKGGKIEVITLTTDKETYICQTPILREQEHLLCNEMRCANADLHIKIYRT